MRVNKCICVSNQHKVRISFVPINGVFKLCFCYLSSIILMSTRFTFLMLHVRSHVEEFGMF